MRERQAMWSSTRRPHAHSTHALPSPPLLFFFSRIPPSPIPPKLSAAVADDDARMMMQAREIKWISTHS